MPYATDRDRHPHLLELEQTPWPMPPLELIMTRGINPGVIDLWWKNPAELAVNSRFTILGVNVYRSFDSEFGPFERISEMPVGAQFWRDQTDNVLVLDETVDDARWVLRGAATTEVRGKRFVFKTEHAPIVKSGSQNIPADYPGDVRVYIDGVQATVLRVDGVNGEIEIDPSMYPEVGTQTRPAPPLPGEGSLVQVSYHYNRSFLRTDLDQRIFYRVTTVGIPLSLPADQVQPQDLLETPLTQASATSRAEIEKLDWIWREAIRRNRWILDQGGERAKVFCRKNVGQACLCIQNPEYQQPLNDCLLCFGTGIFGGYEGPYDIVIAPDDAERRIAQKDVGRTVEHAYEVWTGPSPLLSQRDFIVKLNGDRYSVGPVRTPSNRGMVLQQHFNIGRLDEKDIRYRVPLDNPYLFALNQVNPLVPPQHNPAVVTDKPNIPDEREIRGRTVAWENITYAIPFFLFLRAIVDGAVSLVV